MSMLHNRLLVMHLVLIVSVTSNVAVASDRQAVAALRTVLQHALANDSNEASDSLFTDNAKSRAKGKAANVVSDLRTLLDAAVGRQVTEWEFRRQAIRFPVDNVALEDVVCVSKDKDGAVARRALVVYVKKSARWQVDEFRLPKKWVAEAPFRLLPEVAAPRQHKQVYEDEHVRVFRVTNPPGGVAPPHVHVFPSVVIFDEPASLIVRDEDGKVLEKPKASDIPLVQFGPGGGSPYSVENVDDHPIRLWRIEIKNLQTPIDLDRSK